MHIDKAYWNEEPQVLRRACIPDHEYTETSLYRCFRCEVSPRSDFDTVPIFGMLPASRWQEFAKSNAITKS